METAPSAQDAEFVVEILSLTATYVVARVNGHRVSGWVTGPMTPDVLLTNLIGDYQQRSLHDR